MVRIVDPVADLEVALVGGVLVDRRSRRRVRGAPPGDEVELVELSGSGPSRTRSVGGPLPADRLAVLVDDLRVGPADLPVGGLDRRRTASPSSTSDAGTLGRWPVPKSLLEHLGRAHDGVGAAVDVARTGRRTSAGSSRSAPSVPAMNATPRMTASAVSTKRSLCAASPLRVTFHIALLAQPAHLVEHGVGGRVAELVDDAAVGEEHDPVRVRGGDRVVRDHHDRLAELARPPFA